MEYGYIVFLLVILCGYALAQNNEHFPAEKTLISKKSIQLFMYKGCVYCTKVLLFIKKHSISDSILFIDADKITNKKLLLQISGRTQAPYLVDLDENICMPESDDIIRYLARKFNIDGYER